MKPKLYILLFFVLGFLPAFAKHITGGEVIYRFISADATSRRYSVTLILFRDENCLAPCAEMPATVSLGIYNNDNGTLYNGYRSVSIDEIRTLPQNPLPLCIENPPILTYTAGFYTFEISLPNNNNGYTITYQTCCRIDNIENTSNRMGATYVGLIPGKNSLGDVLNDNSPQFARGISIVCYNRPFTLDFSATDADGDSLVYSLCSAYDGGDASDASYASPAAPPYGSIPYSGGYSGTFPMGPLASINPQTGIISGIAPGEGKYVVSVCINAYRNGRYIASHRKDFIISVAPCDFAFASLPAAIPICDVNLNRTITFSNQVQSPLNETFFWEFGDGASSTEETPTHQYPDTGTYLLKLVVNRGSSCADSSTSLVKVYPGYFAGMNQNSPKCINKPVSFSDSTVTIFGQVNSWHWDFGVQGVNSDTSIIRNPTYTYTTAGDYTATLIVKSSKGCIDTVQENVKIVERPEMTIPNDTLICNIDSLRLNAVVTGPGNITWSPNYMISNVNSFTPLVSPDVTTTYTVNFIDNSGCEATDQLTVRVVDRVSLSAMPDTAICRSDTIQLQISSDGLSYQWTPPQTLSVSNIKTPTATPVDSITNYHVIARIGKCFSEEDIRIVTAPYPNANAGRDSTVCFGTPAYLHASGGSSYLWSPNLYLSNNQVANPIATPEEDIRYIVQVTDNKGCPKPDYDTVFVDVATITADAGPRDTAVVINQPLQLNATGSSIYLWTPGRWLDNANIANPVSLPRDSIEYVVRVSNPIGCFDYDTIMVRVFLVDPGLYVPNAFTPGADGINDNFKPIALGIKSLHYFRIYNRWGQMVFNTSVINRGWNGVFNGKDQPLGTYVWEAKATDYLGRQITKKGHVILIR